MSDQAANPPEPPLIETIVASKDVAPPPSRDEVQQALAVLERHYKAELSAIRKQRKKIEANREASEKAASEAETNRQKVAEIASTITSTAARSEESARKARESADSAASAQANAVAAEQVVTSSRTSIEEKAQYIEKVGGLARVAEKQSNEIKAWHAATQNNRSAAEKAKSGAEAASNAAAAALKAIQATKTEVDTSKTEVAKLQEEVVSLEAGAREAAGETDSLVERLTKAEEDVIAYKSDLLELTESYEEIHTRIESLLPGATSAGLAQAFEMRGNKFGSSLVLWNVVFILSVLALIGVGISFKIAISEAALDLSQAMLVTLFRLPIALPLVWLAVHAAKRASGIRRIEEDYAYKSVMSRSFEGYRRQLEDIEVDSPTDTPIRKLCADLLHMLSLPPGRLHDARYQEATPMSVVAESMKSLRKGLRAKVSTPVAKVEIEDTPETKDEE